VAVPSGYTDPTPGNNSSSDTDTVQYDPSALSKTLADTNQTFTTGTNAAIGEILIYQVSLTIPPGTFTSAQLVDTMGHGLAFVACESITASNPGLTTSIGTFILVCANPTLPLPASGSPADEDNGRPVTYNFGTLTNSSGSDQTLTIRYRAVVLDIDDNQANINLQNSAAFSALNSGSPVNLGPASSPAVTLLEPELAIQKTTDNNFIANGTQVTFTLTITHAPASQTDAFNVIVLDGLPTGLDFVGAAPVCTAGFVDCSYDLGTRTVRAEWSSFTLLPAGNNLQVTFTVQGNASLPAGSLTNVATVEWSSLPGDVSAPQSSYNTYSTERFYDPTDPAGLNNYGDDDSLVLNPLGGGDGAGGQALIPVTGFAPGRVTNLSGLPVTAYNTSTNLTLDIPKLKLKMPIVGVPLSHGSWDVNWLLNQAGWLNRTAFPGFTGNSVLTAHVTLSNGDPGLFGKLYNLSPGDKIFVHAFGQLYIYEVRSMQTVEPNDITIFRHEEKAWLTLVTCDNYDETLGAYLNRTVVRAVLIQTQADLAYYPGR